MAITWVISKAILTSAIIQFLYFCGNVVALEKAIDPVGQRVLPHLLLRSIRGSPGESKPLFTSSTTLNGYSEEDKACGFLCVSPGRKPYPIGRQPGIQFYSQFVVPDLPSEHDPSNTTYYDYLNIFWRNNPVDGYMNQFVPQLMLGTALANSTNFPDYHPLWIQLESWHIGAQYFMGLCVKTNESRSHDDNNDNNNINNSDDDGGGFECDPATWTPKAATGTLLPVEPGEIIETSIQLVPSRGYYEWHLRIGVLDEPHRTSIVVVDRPFMGLVESTTSWMEDIYEMVNVGSCLENYGMVSPRQYPPTWDMIVDIWPTTRTPNDTKLSFWRAWSLEDRNICSWQPKSKVISVEVPSWQRAVWKVAYDDEGIQMES